MLQVRYVEVSRSEFFKRIYEGALDVHPSIVSDFPYTSVWRFIRKTGTPIFGKTVDSAPHGGLLKTSYFLAV